MFENIERREKGRKLIRKKLNREAKTNKTKACLEEERRPERDTRTEF